MNAFSNLRRAVPVGVVVAATALPAQAQMTCRASLTHYEAVEAGVSLSNVIDIIGCEGVSMSERTVDGVTLQSFAWNGNGAPGSNMILLFADDALINRQQIGLR